MNLKTVSLAAGCSLALLALPARAMDKASEPMKDLNKAASVVQQMQRDPSIAILLRNSKGVLIVPDYGAASLGVGGSGGNGVLIAHRNGTWSDPVFYNLGKVSVGVQAGVSAGSIAMVLTSDRALESFYGNNNISLTADAGLSIVNWSKDAQGDIGKGHDVVVWSDTEGLLGRASVGISDVARDDSEDRAFYGQEATTQQIIEGKVSTSYSNPLKSALQKL